MLVAGGLGFFIFEYNGVVSGQNLKDGRSPEEVIAEAVRVAGEAEYVIFIGGLNKSAHQDCEDSDRTGTSLYHAKTLVGGLAAALCVNIRVQRLQKLAIKPYMHCRSFLPYNKFPYLLLSFCPNRRGARSRTGV